MKTIIFDLDLTLVDSSIAEQARKDRNWSLTYSLIPRFRLYDGIPEVFRAIRSRGNKVAIVSTSPSSYVRRVVEYFNMPVDVIIGYHDAQRKPAPDGMLLALRQLGAKPSEAVSFGDRAIDIQASNAAGIKSVACTWGTKELYSLQHSYPDVTIDRAQDMLSYI